MLTECPLTLLIWIDTDTMDLKFLFKTLNPRKESIEDVRFLPRSGFFLTLSER